MKILIEVVLLAFTGVLPTRDAICPTGPYGSCPAPAPCLCQNGIISCVDRNLSCVPHILPKLGNYHTLNLGHNFIVKVSDSAFSSLNITSLFLDHNNISAISDFAFKGLEKLKYLHLQNNNLLFLPDALKNFLINLKLLDISYNPIDGERILNNSLVEGFSDDVARVIGNTVTSFKFGDPRNLLHWPRTLSHFQQLKSLHISGLNIAIMYIPPSQFNSFQYTLEILRIENTQLLQIPHGIAKLIRLKELYIRRNAIRHGDDIIVENVFIDIGDTLETLALEYDNLTKSPQVFGHLINLKNLSLEGNPLMSITDETVQSLRNGKLLFLNLKNCGLNTVPGTISELTSLEELDLSKNNIVTIERKDVAKLLNLTSISFTGNPLIHIARANFYLLPSLKRLNLSNTRLTQIPQALRNLNNIQIVDFTTAKIECTCGMSWVKRWFDLYGMEVYMRGQCENIDNPIQWYIDNRVPHCPEYQAISFG